MFTGVGTSGHVCHGQSLDRVRRLTACIAAIVLAIGIVSVVLAAPRAHQDRQLALASAAGAAPRPHVVEVDWPATSTTIVPPTPAIAPPAAPVPAPDPAPAQAAPPSSSTPAARGAQALDRIDYPWEHLGFSITFEGPNRGLLGKADCNTDRISIYVRPQQSVQQLAFVIAFELGHAVDCSFMDDRSRSQWASIRGFPDGWRWFPGCVCTEDDFGSGDISMVFATWLVPDGGYRWRSNLAPAPSPEQLQRLLPYLRR
ncbi:MAG: hypothetical protein QOD30_1093 [Actinomycetota bacterium]|jgi:hypothetical protein|nr:hypothetical protein [Actinomycetota bacterium]